MTFPRVAQEVGCNDTDRRILFFCRWFEVNLIFFLAVFLFRQLYIDHSFTYVHAIDLKKSAFKEEKSWRFDSEVSNSRHHDSILFLIFGRVHRWGVSLGLMCVHKNSSLNSLPLSAPSLCTNQSLLSFCLAVTPEKSETVKQASNQSIKIIHDDYTGYR